MSDLKPEIQEEKPPIFSSWWQLYTFVLIAHAVFITVLYFFTSQYS